MDRGRRGKEGIEDALARIVNSLNIGHPPVSREWESRDMALRAANVLQELATRAGHRRLLVDSGRKVVEEIELEEINQASRELVSAHKEGVVSDRGCHRVPGRLGSPRGCLLLPSRDPGPGLRVPWRPA